MAIPTVADETSPLRSENIGGERVNDRCAALLLDDFRASWTPKREQCPVSFQKVAIIGHIMNVPKMYTSDSNRCVCNTQATKFVQVENSRTLRGQEALIQHANSALHSRDRSHKLRVDKKGRLCLFKNETAVSCLGGGCPWFHLKCQAFAVFRNDGKLVMYNANKLDGAKDVLWEIDIPPCNMEASGMCYLSLSNSGEIRAIDESERVVWKIDLINDAPALNTRPDNQGLLASSKITLEKGWFMRQDQELRLGNTVLFIDRDGGLCSRPAVDRTQKPRCYHGGGLRGHSRAWLGHANTFVVFEQKGDLCAYEGALQNDEIRAGSWASKHAALWCVSFERCNESACKIVEANKSEGGGLEVLADTGERFPLIDDNRGVNKRK